MFNRLVDRVRDFFGSNKSSVIVKEPRVIPASVHRIDPSLVSVEAKKTCEALQRRGYRAYIVGGAVRDLLRGATPKDFDVATDATPEQVRRCQKRAVIIGRRFQIVHVMFGREIIECSTFRALEGAGQRKDSTGRVLSDNVFGEMWEDAARRDFTVNALYYDPKTEEVFDYHNGYEDIKRGYLRMIGEPEQRYREDPVRMMRAIRIAAKLGFAIDPDTEAPIPKMAHLLENVPSARLVDEILKLLTCGHALSCMRKLREEGLQKAILPVLDIIVSEPDGQEFFELALQRTDERIARGKKISPFFLFATLLWPQVVKRWRYNEEERKMRRLEALHVASTEVLATQCQLLNIQRSYQVDMHDVWMLQARMEKRTGRSTYALVEHPRFRAAYDFMMLRLAVGHVDPDLCRWWSDFAVGGEEERAALIDEARREARHTGDKARQNRNSRRQSAQELGIAESLPPGVGTGPKQDDRGERGSRSRSGRSRGGDRGRRGSRSSNSQATPERVSIDMAEAALSDRPILSTPTPASGTEEKRRPPRKRHRSRSRKKLTQQEIAKAMAGQSPE